MRRLRRALLVLAALSALGPACTPGNDTGASAADPSAWSSTDGAPAGTGRTAPAAGPHARWELADGLATWRKATARARSSHLGGEHDAEVRVNDAAAAYPSLGPQRRLDAGAVVVEALYDPGAEAVVTYLAMAKSRAEGGKEAWEYLVIAPSGEIEQRGLLPLCERCHAEAPDDHLFGHAR